MRLARPGKLGRANEFAATNTRSPPSRTTGFVAAGASAHGTSPGDEVPPLSREAGGEGGGGGDGRQPPPRRPLFPRAMPNPVSPSPPRNYGNRRRAMATQN